MKKLYRHIHILLYLFILIGLSCSEEEEAIQRPVNAATNIQVLDIANAGNASDIELSFQKATKEADLLEYRAIVVSTNDNSILDVEIASKLSSDSYQAISITNNNISLRLNENLNSLSGEPIQKEEFYIVYILSISNGLETNFNQLSVPSISFKISDKSDPARNVNLIDVGNNKNAKDFRVSFVRARIEERVSKYRIFLVPSAKALDFNVQQAELLNANQYEEVLANDSDHVVDFKFNFLDVDKNRIAEGKAYRALILSIEDGVNALNKELSQPSNELFLQNSSYVKTISDKFQGSGGLAYHPDGYLISGNTSGSFYSNKGIGTYKISLEGIFEHQTLDLMGCNGNDYLPGVDAILQGTQNGIYRILDDGTSKYFAGYGSVTDVKVQNSKLFYASNCFQLLRYDFKQASGVFIPKKVRFQDDTVNISCIRYIELDGNGIPIIMKYNSNKLFKIIETGDEIPATVHVELAVGENFTSIVYVASRNSIFATTSERRVLQILEFKRGATSFAGNGEHAIVDGSLESSSFINPVNITASPDGNTLYVLDEVNKDDGIVILRKIEIVD